MMYKELGKTREKIAAIGMGTWKIGSLDRDIRKREINVLKLGIELGSNFVDTAESYSAGESERVVAEALRGQRDRVFIATKVSPDHLSYDDLIKACNRSLERLGTKYIDLYQIHWPNPRIPIRETMRAMEKLVEEGKIRYIGVSNFSLEQLKEAQASLSKNEVVSNQVEYSLVNRSIETDLLPYMQKEHITVIAYSPLARGRIENVIVPDSLLAKYSATKAQMMLAWLIHHEDVVAIPKAAREEHMRENIAAADIRIEQKDYDALSRL